MTARLGALSLVVSLLGVATCRAEPIPARHVLPNGLTLLVREEPGAAVVAASLQVRAGAGAETRETAGITNLLQRVMVRGTVKRSAAELDEALEEIGGSLSASGDVDVGEIRGEALGRYWAPLLGLLAEIAREPRLAPDEVARERRLILSQIRARADAPFSATLDALLGELYGAHPYAWPGPGLETSVARLAEPAVVARYRELYRPERLVLAVSGAVRADPVVRAVTRLFATMPRGGETSDDALPAPTPSGARRVLRRPAQQAQVVVGYLAPPVGDPDHAPLRVLAAALGGGMSGRLFVELRDKRGLAYSLGAMVPFRRGPGFLVTYLGTAPENLATAEGGVLGELDRIRAGAVKDDELARAKAYLQGTLAMERRTNARHAWSLAFFEAIGAGWDFPERYARALEAVTAADVARVARRYLVHGTIVVLEPPPATR